MTSFSPDSLSGQGICVRSLSGIWITLSSDSSKLKTVIIRVLNIMHKLPLEKRTQTKVNWIKQLVRPKLILCCRWGVWEHNRTQSRHSSTEVVRTDSHHTFRAHWEKIANLLYIFNMSFSQLVIREGCFTHIWQLTGFSTHLTSMLSVVSFHYGNPLSKFLISQSVFIKVSLLFCLLFVHVER